MQPRKALLGAAKAPGEGGPGKVSHVRKWITGLPAPEELPKQGLAPEPTQNQFDEVLTRSQLELFGEIQGSAITPPGSPREGQAEGRDTGDHSREEDVPRPLPDLPPPARPSPPPEPADNEVTLRTRRDRRRFSIDEDLSEPDALRERSPPVAPAPAPATAPTGPSITSVTPATAQASPPKRGFSEERYAAGLETPHQPRAPSLPPPAPPGLDSRDPPPRSSPPPLMNTAGGLSSTGGLRISTEPDLVRFSSPRIPERVAAHMQAPGILSATPSAQAQAPPSRLSHPAPAQPSYSATEAAPTAGLEALSRPLPPLAPAAQTAPAAAPQPVAAAVTATSKAQREAVLELQAQLERVTVQRDDLALQLEDMRKQVEMSEQRALLAERNMKEQQDHLRWVQSEADDGKEALRQEVERLRREAEGVKALAREQSLESQRALAGLWDEVKRARELGERYKAQAQEAREELRSERERREGAREALREEVEALRGKVAELEGERNTALKGWQEEASLRRAAEVSEKRALKALAEAQELEGRKAQSKAALQTLASRKTQSAKIAGLPTPPAPVEPAAPRSRPPPLSPPRPEPTSPRAAHPSPSKSPRAAAAMVKARIEAEQTEILSASPRKEGTPSPPPSPSVQEIRDAMHRKAQEALEAQRDEAFSFKRAAEKEAAAAAELETKAKGVALKSAPPHLACCDLAFRIALVRVVSSYSTPYSRRAEELVDILEARLTVLGYRVAKAVLPATSTATSEIEQGFPGSVRLAHTWLLVPEEIDSENAVAALRFCRDAAGPRAHPVFTRVPPGRSVSLGDSVTEIEVDLEEDAADAAVSQLGASLLPLLGAPDSTIESSVLPSTFKPLIGTTPPPLRTVSFPALSYGPSLRDLCLQLPQDAEDTLEALRLLLDPAALPSNATVHRLSFARVTDPAHAQQILSAFLPEASGPRNLAVLAINGTEIPTALLRNPRGCTHLRVTRAASKDPALLPEFPSDTPQVVIHGPGELSAAEIAVLRGLLSLITLGPLQYFELHPSLATLGPHGAPSLKELAAEVARIKTLTGFNGLTLQRDGQGTLTALTRRGAKSRALWDSEELTLDLTECSLGALGAELFVLASRSQTELPANPLRILRLNGCQLGPKGCAALLEGLLALGEDKVQLQELDLRANGLGPEGFRLLAPLLARLAPPAAPDRPCLQILDLSNNVAQDEGAACVLSPSVLPPSLVCLALAGNALGNAGAKALSQCMEALPALEILDVSRNQMGDEAGRSVLAAIATAPSKRGSPEPPTLRHLDMSENFSLGPDTARGLVSLLASARRLESLNFTLTRVLSDLSACKGIAQGLCVCPSLRTLNLAACKLKSEGAKVLADHGLGQAPSLRILDLSRNDLGDRGVSYLLPAIGQISTLEVLSLKAVSVGVPGMQLLIPFVKLRRERTPKYAPLQILIEGNDRAPKELVALLASAGAAAPGSPKNPKRSGVASSSAQATAAVAPSPRRTPANVGVGHTTTTLALDAVKTFPPSSVSRVGVAAMPAPTSTSGRGAMNGSSRTPVPLAGRVSSTGGNSRGTAPGEKEMRRSSSRSSSVDRPIEVTKEISSLASLASSHAGPRILTVSSSKKLLKTEAALAEAPGRLSDQGGPDPRPAGLESDSESDVSAYGV